jgi:hypothetical protein
VRVADTIVSQVGIMFSGSGEVENLMIGGPAYLTVLKGDVILKVDGEPVSGSAALFPAIVGEDIPGSILNLTLKRGEEIVEVAIKRISTDQVADKRRMFDLFTQLNDRAKKDQDQEAAIYVQETLMLWEKMTIADQIHDDQIVENVNGMQADLISSSDEISGLLQDIWAQQKWGPSTPPSIPLTVKSSAPANSSIQLYSSPIPPPKFSPVHLSLRLEMELAEAGDEESSERADFDKDLYKDLARASQQPERLFLVKKLSPGSIIVDLDILPDPSGKSKDPSTIAHDLERQAKDPNSLLRSGKITSSISSLLVGFVHSTDFSARKGRTPVGIQFSSRSSVRWNVLLTLSLYFKY